MDLTRNTLAEFLRRVAAADFREGEWDCAMTIANWVLEATGRDPALEFRGRYASTLGWAKIVRREGGLVPLVDRLMLSVGLRQTGEAQEGDVGVVPSLVGATCAIRVARGWAAKVGPGLLVAPSAPLAAWTFRNPARLTKSAAADPKVPLHRGRQVVPKRLANQTQKAL